MRTGVVIALALLAVIVAAGIWSGMTVVALSTRYYSAAREVEILVEKEAWGRAAEVTDAYLDTWRDTVPWLQMLINHEDADEVTLALVTLQAGIKAKEQATCYEACSLLRENAQHLYHRDAFTPGNVL